MYLVEQHIISVNDKRYKDLDRICFLSKNLYNAALYEIKQEFLRTGKWIRYTSLDRKLKDEDNFDYRAISAASSQQILMSLDKSLKSYFLLSKHGKEITRNLPVVLSFQNTNTRLKVEMCSLTLMHSLSTEIIIFSFLRKKVCRL